MAAEDQTSSGKKTTIIRFNVGGKLYEVSRSLIEQQNDTMLARLVSEIWEQKGSGNEAVFIERDSERFAYVLDYLRDGQVYLPATISKEALMMDMDYYGIVADGTKIAVNFGIARLQEINCLMKERDYIMAAISCLKKYVDEKSVRPTPTSATIAFSNQEKECMLFKDGFDADLLRKCLAAQGLKLVSNTDDYKNIFLDRLP
jgi:hypothetical protein